MLTELQLKKPIQMSAVTAWSLPIPLPLEGCLQSSCTWGVLCFKRVKASLFYNKTVPTLLMTVSSLVN